MIDMIPLRCRFRPRSSKRHWPVEIDAQRFGFIVGNKDRATRDNAVEVKRAAALN